MENDTSNSKYTCRNCSNVCCSIGDLNRHLKAHKLSESEGLGEHACHLCHKEYKSKASLDLHLKYYHDTDEQFSCDICGKKFTIKSNLTKHRDIHDKDRIEFYCDMCAKGFVTKQALKKHMETHKAKRIRYPCEVCGHQALRESSLKSHMLSHDKKTEFICETCGKGFTWKKSHQMHKDVKMGNK